MSTSDDRGANYGKTKIWLFYLTKQFFKKIFCEGISIGVQSNDLTEGRVESLFRHC
jgi:hypothetical protein